MHVADLGRNGAIEVVVGDEERLQAREVADAFRELAGEVVVGDVEVAELLGVDNLGRNRAHDVVHLNLHHGDIRQAKQT